MTAAPVSILNYRILVKNVHSKSIVTIPGGIAGRKLGTAGPDKTKKNPPQ